MSASENTAQLWAVASAVADGLRAADFLPPGCVGLGFNQRHDLETTGLAVCVMPRKTRTTRITRGSVSAGPLKQVDLDVAVAVFKPLTGTDAEIDGQIARMLWVCQRIEDHFDNHSLPDRPETLVEGNTDATGDLNLDVAALVEKRQFEAILTLTFRGTRRVA